jgi:hypothetical protein
MREKSKINVLTMDARNKPACKPVPTNQDQAGLLNDSVHHKFYIINH